MQPIHSIDTRPAGEDFIDEYRGGPAWGVVVAVLLALALVVGALVIFAGGEDTTSPQEPVPNEAPVDPGA
jgi:hypothetical protein